MSGGFKALKITDRVYWVGAIDWGLRNFHGYLTSRGTTYNAFLVLDDKITLIDTVKPQFYPEMMGRISSVINPKEISYVVSNHSEMDHSGALPRFVHAMKPEKIVASANGVKALKAHFHWDTHVETVKSGDVLNLGNTQLKFVEARMLHWPDSMFSYLDEEGVLFSNDAFGMHLATSERFADEIDFSILQAEGAKYFANILLHLSPLVLRLIDQLPSLNLDIKMIAPDHGPVWRENVGTIVDLYGKWARQEKTHRAIVVYDSMWGSTSRMARAVGDGLKEGGAAVTLMPLDSAHRSDVVTELLDAGALVVGSPTMNNQIYPTVADVVNYLKGLKPKNLVGATFGSFGWSGEAVKHLDNHMREMGVDLVEDGLRIPYVPDDEALAGCRNLGLKVANTLLDSIK